MFLVLADPGKGGAGGGVGRCGSGGNGTEWVVGKTGKFGACSVGSNHNVAVDVRKAKYLLVIRILLVGADGQQRATRQAYVLFNHLVIGIEQCCWCVTATCKGVAVGGCGAIYQCTCNNAVLYVAVIRKRLCTFCNRHIPVAAVVAKLRDWAGAKLSGVAVGVVLGAGDGGVAAAYQAVGMVVAVGGSHAIDGLAGTVAVFAGVGVVGAGATCGGAKTVTVGVCANGCIGQAAGFVVLVAFCNAVFGAGGDEARLNTIRIATSTVLYSFVLRLLPNIRTSKSTNRKAANAITGAAASRAWGYGPFKIVSMLLTKLLSGRQ